MAFNPVYPGVGATNYEATIVSKPDLFSFCVRDTGGGGANPTLYINMAGVNDPTVATAVDLQTFYAGGYPNSTGFGPPVPIFQSIPLARAFGLLPFAAAAGQPGRTGQGGEALVPKILVTAVPLGTSQSLLGIDYDVTSVGAPAGMCVPYLVLIGQGGEGSGYWRVDITLRHSITN
jgi:hypothetical protein